MAKILSVSAEAFCHPTEDADKVEKALAAVLDSPAEASEAETQFGQRMLLLQSTTKKSADIRKMLGRLAPLSRFVPDLDKHLDDEGNIFLRLDKERAFEGILAPHTSGEAIRVKIRLVSFPFAFEDIRATARALVEGKEAAIHG